MCSKNNFLIKKMANTFMFCSLYTKPNTWKLCISRQLIFEIAQCNEGLSRWELSCLRARYLLESTYFFRRPASLRERERERDPSEQWDISIVSLLNAAPIYIYNTHESRCGEWPMYTRDKVVAGIYIYIYVHMYVHTCIYVYICLYTPRQINITSQLCWAPFLRFSIAQN